MIACKRVVLASGLLSVVAQVTAAEPTLEPVDVARFPPVPPSEAVSTFEVVPGFRLELAAHEPEVMDPIALCFDEHGRAYVVEMRDYSERRPERLGRIRRLEDRDGDGYFETSLVFLDGLPWPTAVTCWDGGIFVGATPDLLYAKDTDQDGRADIRETVFTGFASDFAPYATNKLNVQAMMNSLQWGIDGRIHGCGSLSGGKVTRLSTSFTQAWRRRAGSPTSDKEAAAAPLDLRGRDFSFDPRTLELQPENGFGQYGMCFNDGGDRFFCSNSDHLQVSRYEAHYGERESLHPLPSPRASIAADGPAAEVFRLSPEEPWRVIRTRWRVTGLVPGLIEGGGRASGYFTSATGLTIYRGDAYGPDYLGDAFVADCGSNLIHRKKLSRVGCEWVGSRPPTELRREFLACRDTWFRPVQFANAPDGCLWMIDMYREIIEHPWSLPPNLKRLLDLNSGNDRGRLYRIVPATATATATPSALRRSVQLGRHSTAELIELLNHPNGWHRDTASRLLLEQGDPKAAMLLQGFARAAKTPLGKVHALRLLSAMNACDEPLLTSCIAGSMALVQRHALRVAETCLSNSAPTPALAAAMETASKGAPEVRLQLALTLGKIAHPRKAGLLADLLRSSSHREGEGLIVDAALAAAGSEILPLFRAAVADSSADSQAALARLAEIIGRHNQSVEIQELLTLVGTRIQQGASLEWVARLAEGLRRAGTHLRDAGIADSLRTSLLTAALSTAQNSAAGDLQLHAIRVVAELAPNGGVTALAGVLSKGQSSAAQKAAIEAILRSGEAAAFATILERWQNLVPEARTGCFEILLRRPSGARQVLDSLAARKAEPRDLSANQLSALRTHAEADLRARAIELLGAPSASRDDAVSTMLPALNLRGDAARGLMIYEAQCATCHRLGGKGFNLGPDLESVRSQPPEKLLVAIVDPNREVAPNYLATTVESIDGESYTGLASAETSDAITLQQASGVRTVLPRPQVRSVRAEGRSIMPEGFETTLTPQQMADLIACLSRIP
ncbi:MAG: c-type cytochrome [Verrucomicrobiales bacterium]|nr:c-type cytochrome [Verrucomicrobiales bacterium]